MYVIEVIPLSVLPPQVPQILTYFHDETLPRGAVVEIDIQKKKVKGIVLSSVPLEQNKIALKKSAFQLKKLSRVIDDRAQVSHYQLRIAHWISKYYYAPLGMTLKTILPPFFGKRGYDAGVHGGEEIPPDERSTPLPVFITTRARQSFDVVAPHIKDVIKKGGQVLFISPDSETLDYFYKEMQGIAPAVQLTSATPNKEFATLWNAVANGSASLICATRVGLFLPFKNLWLIVVEDPFHEAYKSDMSPRYNAPDVALHIAGMHGARTLFFASAPNLNIDFAIEQKAIELQKKKTPLPGSVEIIDIGYERKTGNFSLFSRKLQEAVLQSIAGNERLLLFSGRKGYSSILVCQHCGTFTKCQNCDVPMRVHITSESMLVCYHCGFYQQFPKQCENCHSANLRPAGTAGSLKIQDELQRLLESHAISGVDTFVLDRDLIRDDAQERELLEQIVASKHPIVIASQLIFSHRYHQQYDTIAVMNADSLMSAADFRVEERFIYQIDKLFDFEPRRMLVQTYNPEGEALTAAIRERHTEFYRSELAVRKALHYPPFTRVIKLSYSHASEKKAAYEARLLNERLKMAIAQYNYGQRVWLSGASPATIAKERGMYSFNVILKISPEFTALDDILRFIPTSWLIDVDPRSMV